MGARDMIEAYLKRLPEGAKFTNADLQCESQIIETARRLRELRELRGWNILSHRDLPNELRMDEYMLGSPRQFSLTDQTQVSKSQSAAALARRPYCEWCHTAAGERNQVTGERTILTVYRRENGALVVLCAHCRQDGISPEAVTSELPTHVREAVRVAPRRVKAELYRWMVEKRIGGELDAE